MKIMKFITAFAFCGTCLAGAEAAEPAGTAITGLAPGAEPAVNRAALQQAADRGGMIRISVPGVYDIDGTIRLRGGTTLEFGPGVILRKVAPKSGVFHQVFINSGAYTGVPDRDITISGLHLQCNGVDSWFRDVVGLRGQLGFFHVENLVIRDFKCLDLPKGGYCIQVADFDGLLVENLHIEGLKDGVHLSGGRNFVIRNGRFRTYDDPIALNAHDYPTGSPNFAWIENGLIENCVDLDDRTTTGYFCRLLAGCWGPWQSGMTVRNGDAVVHNGRLYNAMLANDGRTAVSKTPPTHERGVVKLDGIRWNMQKPCDTFDAGCRNITFRNIVLEKKRPTAFSLHFDADRFSQSVRPGCPLPVQENIVLENIEIRGDVKRLIGVSTPVRGLRISGSRLGKGAMWFAPRNSEIGGFAADLTLDGNQFAAGPGNRITCREGVRLDLTITNSRRSGDYPGLLLDGDIEVLKSDLPLRRD